MKKLNPRFYLGVIIFCYSVNIFSQVNIYDKPKNKRTDKENEVLIEFLISELSLTSVGLVDADVGTFGTKGCHINLRYLHDYITTVSSKESENLIVTYFLCCDIDAEGFLNDYVYAGYAEKRYGESKYYLYKVKRKRVYPENNIFTEIIKFPIENDVGGLIIENREIVKYVFKEGTNFNLVISDYQFDDCNVPK